MDPILFDITADEVRSFDGAFYRPTVIKGPITLARFSDSRRGEAGRYGRFWLYGDYVRELVEAGLSALGLIKEISQQWAISDDWGDKGLLTLMDIPPGGVVPAIWGRAKFQPKVSSRGPRETGRSYEGGALQLVIPVIDTDRRLDPRIAAYIQRKVLTQEILLHPSRVIENPWFTAQRRLGKTI